jgi:hypothetical protein
MLNAAWIEREAPLDQCPLAVCRRQGICRYPTDKNPCRRLYETKDEVREQLAATLQRLTEEARARDPEGRNFAPAGSPEHERRMARLKRVLWQIDHDHCMQQKAEAEARAARGPAVKQTEGV